MSPNALPDDDPDRAEPGSRAASLVIGGTGMLREATLWLARGSSTTVIVARRASAFWANGSRLLAVDADWNSPPFPSRVSAAITEAGPIATALLWLHEPEPVLEWLLPLIGSARVVLVLGSMAGQPRLPSMPPSVATVRLGSMPATHGWRWLTHEEISAGAIAALQDCRSRVIGQLVPLG